jgi:hypothetical protein
MPGDVRLPWTFTPFVGSFLESFRNMKIKLRVVGAFFGASPGVGQNVMNDKFSGTNGEVILDFPGVADLTVADVMKKASADAAAGLIPNVSVFNYSPTNPLPGQFLKEITIVYTKLPPMVTGTGPGPYVLKLVDSSVGFASHELQYYHYREQGSDYIQLNKDNVTKTFSEEPQVPLIDGDSIVWRQVTILFNVNGNPRDLMFALATTGKASRKGNDKTMSGS